MEAPVEAWCSGLLFLDKLNVEQQTRSTDRLDPPPTPLSPVRGTMIWVVDATTYNIPISDDWRLIS
jgi:hypothetical protein